MKKELIKQIRKMLNRASEKQVERLYYFIREYLKE